MDEYAIRIFSAYQNKTYIKARLSLQDKATKEVICDLALKLVNSLCSDPPSGSPVAPASSGSRRKLSRISSSINKRKSQYLLAVDNDDEAIEIMGGSQLISYSTLKQILMNTPSSLCCCKWSLKYDVNINGGSLSNLYYTLEKGCYSACVMIIKDEQQQVFGAFCSERWRPRHDVYGTGESFLFKIPFVEDDTVVSARAKFYPWQRKSDNYCFQMSTHNHIAMGSGGFGYGLWIDNELSTGHSDKCETFANDTLASTSFFKIVGLEVWCPS